MFAIVLFSVGAACASVGLIAVFVGKKARADRAKRRP